MNRLSASVGLERAAAAAAATAAVGAVFVVAVASGVAPGERRRRRRQPHPAAGRRGAAQQLPDGGRGRGRGRRPVARVLLDVAPARPGPGAAGLRRLSARLQRLVGLARVSLSPQHPRTNNSTNDVF